MRRSPRVLIGALTLLVAGGGSVVLPRIISDNSGNWHAGTSTVHVGSLLNAMQAPAVAPTKPTVTAPKSPAPSRSAKPSRKPTSAPTAPAASDAMRNQLLTQINKLRAEHGLPPYALLAGLNASAHKHNLEMMGTCGMSHQCPGEPSLGARISAQGVHWRACGENVGWSGPHPNSPSALISAAEGLTLAMYGEKPPDDGHRRNLLSTQFHYVGIDVVRDSSGKVWLTQDFSG
jgi:uncharacterized protein YkwD